MELSPRMLELTVPKKPRPDRFNSLRYVDFDLGHPGKKWCFHGIELTTMGYITHGQTV